MSSKEEEVLAAIESRLDTPYWQEAVISLYGQVGISVIDQIYELPSRLRDRVYASERKFRQWQSSHGPETR